MGRYGKISWVGWLATILAGIAGCSGHTELVVGLETDLVPGIDFTRVETQVMGASSTRVPADFGQDFVGGQQVADVTGIDGGRTDVLVSLLDQGGDVVAQRRTIVEVSGRFGMTVIITRDCRAVSCPQAGGDPSATECLGGRCVPPECSAEHPSACGMRACMTATDCPAPAAACAEARCDTTLGACLLAPVSGGCADGTFCDPDLGCRRVPNGEGGMPMDAGPLDAGPLDAGPLDAGCVGGASCDTGNPCELGTIDCSSGSPVCVSAGPAAAGTECRAAAGPCDVAETCDGTTTTCAPDAFADATTVCRAAVDACDLAETCTGTSATCPMDGFAPTGTTCTGGSCDGLGTCVVGCTAGAPCATGNPCELGTIDCSTGSVVCMPAGPAPASTVCRAATGVCDAPETCDGASTACPPDTFLPSTTVCRPSAGPCDAPETCDGASTVCPPDVFLPSSSVCRPSAGPCDAPETCNGASTVCPPDVFLPSSSVCRPSAGPCDTPESCTGSSAACPTDTFLPSSTVCRPAAGVCDMPESCNGSSAACPSDALRPGGTICRPAAGSCDTAETCNGTSAACPADAHAADGTGCPSAPRSCLSGILLRLQPLPCVELLVVGSRLRLRPRRRVQPLHRRALTARGRGPCMPVLHPRPVTAATASDLEVPGLPHLDAGRHVVVDPAAVRRVGLVGRQRGQVVEADDDAQVPGAGGGFVGGRTDGDAPDAGGPFEGRPTFRRRGATPLGRGVLGAKLEQDDALDHGSGGSATGPRMPARCPADQPGNG